MTNVKTKSAFLSFSLTACLFFILLIISVRASALTDVEQKIITFSHEHFGQRAGLRIKAWLELTHHLQNQSLPLQLSEVNNFFNQLVFIDDIKLWGEDDYWATPVQFLNAGGGDCEDFSIAKYYTLRELGVDDEKLRLIYVKSLTLNQFHMVLAYYETPSSMPLILDNIDGEIKPASQRSDLVPVYSFNATNLWITKGGVTGSQSVPAGNVSNLSMWQKLRKRSQHDTHHPIINLDQ
ncbi:transglutaminase-like cysteine peptidase [Vibrio algivorus]|uniref:Sulfate adenylyltransferase n=1 Tax=Vibrio algivorus TaxID=1667024 RepID=A0A557PF80_9VIBR|nr:transglutaminase-like cysteine peptidase [Vibrio algivorus]TVO39325.1 sulfate adenylyltransferase [Vibrio algivorus]